MIVTSVMKELSIENYKWFYEHFHLRTKWFISLMPNPSMNNVPKWPDTCCKIFKVCLTILGHDGLNG